MLARAPYQVPSGEDKGRNREAKSGLHVGGTLRIQTGGISVSVKEDNRGEESKVPSPQGRKRTASEDPETMVSKWGKKSLPEGPALGDTLAALCPQGDQSSTEL